MLKKLIKKIRSDHRFVKYQTSLYPKWELNHLAQLGLPNHETQGVNCNLDKDAIKHKTVSTSKLHNMLVILFNLCLLTGIVF